MVNKLVCCKLRYDKGIRNCGATANSCIEKNKRGVIAKHFIAEIFVYHGRSARVSLCRKVNIEFYIAVRRAGDHKLC